MKKAISKGVDAVQAFQIINPTLDTSFYLVLPHEICNMAPTLLNYLRLASNGQVEEHLKKPERPQSASASRSKYFSSADKEKKTLQKGYSMACTDNSMQMLLPQHSADTVDLDNIENHLHMLYDENECPPLVETHKTERNVPKALIVEQQSMMGRKYQSWFNGPQK